MRIDILVSRWEEAAERKGRQAGSSGAACLASMGGFQPAVWSIISCRVEQHDGPRTSMPSGTPPPHASCSSARPVKPSHVTGRGGLGPEGMQLLSTPRLSPSACSLRCRYFPRSPLTQQPVPAAQRAQPMAQTDSDERNGTGVAGVERRPRTPAQELRRRQGHGSGSRPGLLDRPPSVASRGGGGLQHPASGPG